MKVLLANKFFFLKGGAEVVFFQERACLVSRGYEVIDFSMKDPRNYPTKYAGFFVPQVRYEMDSTRTDLKRMLLHSGTAKDFIDNRKAVRRVAALAAMEKPEIAHLHNIYHQISPSIIPVLKNHGAKVVLTLHDYKVICPKYVMVSNDRTCIKCKGKKFVHATIRRCQKGSFLGSLLLSAEAYWHKWMRSYEKVDCFLAPSRFMADLLSKCGIGDGKIRVLRNGVDIKQYEFSEEDRGYGLFLGRISKEKGLETLLNAYAMLPTKLPLKIVGTGPLAAELKRRKLGVQFAGYKEGRQLKEFIKGASFVVVPSEWHENCSMTVLEAMACGKPVIASRVGGIPEQVEDGKTGLLFEAGNAEALADKMKLLAENEDLRRIMGRAGRRKVEADYTLDLHCSKLLELYESVVSDGKMYETR